MNTDSRLPSNPPRPSQSALQRILRWPSTPLGWWALGLVAAFGVLMLLNDMLLMRSHGQVGWRQALQPLCGIAMALCALAAGIVGLVAFTRQHERSWLMWPPMLAGLFIIIFLLGSVFMPR